MNKIFAPLVFSVCLMIVACEKEPVILPAQNGISVKTFGRFKVENRIIDKQDRVGGVATIYSNGTARTYIHPNAACDSVLPDSQYYNLSDLARSYKCVGPACIEDSVFITSENTEGWISELFDNGKARVFTKKGYFIKDLKDLGYKFKCNKLAGSEACDTTVVDFK